LLKTDLLLESAVALVKKRFLYLFLLPIWLLRGRAHLKREIANRVQLNVALLPYRRSFLDWLKQEHAAGRRLILATASDEQLARPIADHLGLFEDVIASTGDRNLKGTAKRDALVAKFGPKGFSYAGDAAADLAIWGEAGEAILVGASDAVAARAAKLAPVANTFPSERGNWRTFRKAIRVHQWSKNALVFVPVLTAHRISDLAIDTKAGLGFVSFSLCASAVYLANDLMDLDSDRRHRTKSQRPFASGALPLSLGLVAAPAFVITAFALAFWLSPLFALVLATYFAVTNAYTFWLKREALLDVLCLATLYTLRIFAGGQSTELPVSMWLIALSMFEFLSLALVKRVSELRLVKESSEQVLHGRGYAVGDLSILSEAGLASGYMAVLVFALYIHSDEVKPLYSHPSMLWFICPLILYWNTRVWLLTHRGRMHDDPVLFAVRDRASYVVGLLAVAVMFLAR
jgi:4-hydroxybenzoate polyprenyltransferase